MAGTDNIVFNVRERPLSTDQNNVESILGRTLMDLLRYAQSRRVLCEPGDAVQNVVVGGLLGSPSGSDVSVSPGVLLQDSLTLAPVPGSLDSSYRIGIQRTPLVQVMPAPGVDTWYLIEAQMVEVTTSTENRDILNSGTGVFVPTPVPKIRERRIQLQLLTGGAQAPAPTGGDWVPLMVVLRPAGGPPVLPEHIVDVRNLANFGQELSTKPAVEMDRVDVLLGAGAATNNVQVFSQISGPGGKRGFQLLSSSAFSEDMTSARFISPAAVLAANTRFYLYLAPWSALGLNPRFNGGVNDSYEGILVLSGVAPTSSGRNSGIVSLPAPWNVVPAPANTAYYVATLMRNSVNTGWAPMQRVDGEVLLPINPTSAWVQTFSPPAGTWTPGNHGISPRARELLVHFAFTGAGAAAWKTLSVIDAASGFVLASTTVIDNGIHSGDLAVPYDGQATLDAAVGGGNAGDVLTIAVRGYRE